MAVRAEDQLAAVFVALPFRNDFDIDPFLDGSRDEHATKRPLTVRCESEPLTRSSKGFLGVFDL